MINPEAIKTLMLSVKEAQAIGARYGVYREYHKGEMAGLADCLLIACYCLTLGN